MSLWLLRTSPSLFAYTSRRSQHNIWSHSISTLVLRRHLVAPRSAAAAASLRRLQSSKPSPGSGTRENRDVSVDSASSVETKSFPPAPKEPKPAPLMTRAWKKVKHEAAHYWHGSKLLVSEVRISARLQWKILHGESLTRRERRQARLEDLLHISYSVY